MLVLIPIKMSSCRLMLLWSGLTVLCLVTGVILCINQDGLSYCGNHPKSKWLKTITFTSLSHCILTAGCPMGLCSVSSLLRESGRLWFLGSGSLIQVLCFRGVLSLKLSVSLSHGCDQLGMSGHPESWPSPTWVPVTGISYLEIFWVPLQCPGLAELELTGGAILEVCSNSGPRLEVVPGSPCFSLLGYYLSVF